MRELGVRAIAEPLAANHCAGSDGAVRGCLRERLFRSVPALMESRRVLIHDAETSFTL